jgi:PTS system galactitol-specific IIB component
MNRPAIILVMGGSSIATSTLAAVKIEEEAERRGIRVTVKKGKVADADMLISFTKADVVVSTSIMTPKEGIPFFSGVPLLTGIGQKELYDELFATIQGMSD